MSNTEQQEFWTDDAGPIWVAQQRAMDTALAPVLDAVLTRADIGTGAKVLDIGCGAGTSTLAAAQRTGASGAAHGFDISATLLDRARTLAQDIPQAAFTQADAQTHPFEADQYDLMISRFGVMFFNDTDAAFANLARALKPGGRMVFAAWGAIGQNPFFTMPAGIAKTQIGAVPKSDPDAPGPFAMRKPARVTAMLRGAGLSHITAEEVEIALTPSGDAQEVAHLMCQIGPAQAALSHFEAGAADRARLIAALTDGMAPFQTPDGIRIPSLINLFTAQA